MKLKIYTADANNRFNNLTNKYETTKEYNVYISNNVKILRLNVNDESEKAKIKYVSVGKNVQKIDEYCFSGCSELTCVNGSESITQIGNYAFQNCTSIAAIPLMEYGKKNVGQYSFIGCTSLKRAEIHKYGTEKPIIGVCVYSNCTGLKNAHIEGDVTKQMFIGCTSLLSAYLTDCNYVGQEAFKGCIGLTAINLTSQTYLETNAFYGCTGLTSVITGNNLTSIQSGCFQGCSGLKNISLGTNITDIQDYAFYGCTNLQTIDISNTKIVQILEHTYQNTGLTSFVVPSAITSLDSVNLNFLANTNVTKITFLGFPKSYLVAKKDEPIWKFGSTTVTYIQCKETTYKVNDDGTLVMDKMMCIIETNLGTGLCSGCLQNIRNFYDMVHQMNTDDDRIDYFLLGDEAANLPAGYDLEPSTKANFFSHVDEALRAGSEYSALIIYVMNHGSGSSIGLTASERLYGTDIANHVLAGDLSKRIFFICDCCLAEGMAPFSASLTNSEDNNQSVDIVDSIFDTFKRRKMALTASGSASSSDPIFLAWYTCDSSHNGWMSTPGGSKFLMRIKYLFSRDEKKTYASLWDLVGATPYTYDLKPEKYYGYVSGGKYTAYHKRRNHNNLFNESLPVFT